MAAQYRAWRWMLLTRALRKCGTSSGRARARDFRRRSGGRRAPIGGLSASTLILYGKIARSPSFSAFLARLYRIAPRSNNVQSLGIRRPKRAHLAQNQDSWSRERA
jgi:hypothetical protein